nr:hemicentin-1-like isoform X2 [Halyomorpha halys]
MARFPMLRLIIGLLLVYCESVSSDTEEIPSDKEATLLSVGEEMNDDELWNLLKQISRNGSDQDPFGGFTDYEEYTLVDELYTTDVTEASSVDNTEIESTTETDNFASTGSDSTTENKPLEETATVENVTPLDDIESTTPSTDVTTEPELDVSTVEDVSKNEFVKPNYSSQSTVYPSSTINPPVNISSDSTSEATIIPSSSISTSLPGDLTSTEASLRAEVPGSFTEITSTTVASNDSVTTPISTSMSPVTERTSRITDKEPTLVTSDVTTSPATTVTNGSLVYITSTPIGLDTLFTKDDITPTTPLATIKNNESDILIGSSTTEAQNLGSGSAETTTLLSTKESEETVEFVRNTSTSIETSPSSSTEPFVISSVSLTSVPTTVLKKDTDGFSTTLPTVYSTKISEKLSSTPSTSPNSLKSTEVTVSTDATATKPFKETDEVSTTPPSVTSTNVSEKLSSTLTTPSVTADTREISESTVSPRSIITDATASWPTFPNTMEFIKVTDSESTATEPFSKVTDEFPAKLPTVESTNVSVTLSSALTTTSGVTTEQRKITESTVTVSILPTVTTTVKSIKVSDSESTVIKPLEEETTTPAAMPTSSNNLADQISSTSTVATPSNTVHGDINRTTSLHVDLLPSTVPDKIKTPVTGVPVNVSTSDNRVMTEIPIIKAHNTETTTFVSTTTFSIGTPTTILNEKINKTVDSSLSEPTSTTSTTTRFPATLGKSTTLSVRTDGTSPFTTERNKDTNKQSTTSEISNDFSTVSTLLTTIKINDVTKREGEKNHTEAKPLNAPASHPDLELVGATEPFKYKVTTEKMSTTASTKTSVYSTVTKVTDAKTKTTAPTPSAKIDQKLFTKKKISLDPSKKVFISIEDPIIPQLNLREKSFTTSAPQIEETTETLLNKTKFYPKLKTTVYPQHKVKLEPGRKVSFIPENKVESLVTTQYPEYVLRKHKIPNRKEDTGSTTVRPHSTSKSSSSRSNLDRSRIFMIDEATLTPMKIDLPPVSCCDKHLSLDKISQNKPNGNLPHIQIPYFRWDQTNVNPEMKHGGDSPRTKVSVGETNLETKPLSKKKLSFDPNRMHILDTYPVTTSAPPFRITPTTMKKSALDKNRKFMIDSDDTITNFKPKGKANAVLPKMSYNNKKIMTRPVIQIIPSINNSHKDKDNVDQTKALSSKGYNEEVKYKITPSELNPQQSIPELLCFQVKKKDKKPILSCIPLDSTIKTNFIRYLNHVEDPQNRQQMAPILRKVVIKNPTPVATSVIKTFPTLNKMKYSVHAHVLNTGSNNLRGPTSMKASFNTPDRQVFVTNNQMQDIVRHSIIPIQHVASKQSLLFLEQPPNPESYHQKFSIRVEGNVPNRSKRSVTNKCNFDGVYEDEGSSLAFVFDNTGSMSPELEQMRETAKHITKELTEKKRNLIRDYILVTFNDPMVAAPFCTSNYDDFIDELNRIRVLGGQDCPELALTGLKSTLEVARPNSFIFVITDADAKDYDEEENIQLLIMRKSPYIFFLMTERCYGWRHDKGFNVYYNISKQTNGQIIMLDKSDVRQSSLLRKMLDSLTEDFLQQGLVPLKRISSNKPANVPYSVPVPVDPGIKKVTFVVSGPQPKLDITDPKGDKPPGEPKEFPKFKSVTYKEPIPGVWKAHVGSSSGHSFSSYGISKVQLRVGFSIIPTNKSSETSHRPLKSAENYILIEASNPELVKNITHVDLVDLNSNFLGTILLKKDDTTNTIYSGGPFLPPDQNFNIEVNGYATDGSPLKRISPNAILPQLPELPYVTLPRESTFDEGTTRTIKCRVESLVPTTVKMYRKNDPQVQQVQNMKQTGDVFLELRNISVKDEGIYICSASNVAGNKLKEIKVNIQAKPPVVSVKDEVLYTLRNKVLIPCFVYSVHPYRISWKKGTSSRWTEIYNSTNIQNTDKGLMILNPKMNDEGWYQCTASSIGGDSVGTSYLKFSLPPSIEVSGLRRFYEHFNLTLTCSAIRGVPAPQLKWKKNGVEFNGENGRIFITNMEKYSRIDIVDARLKDEGNYECSATNFAGQDVKDLQLTFEEKPKATATVKTCNIVYGGNCTLKCTISGRPFPDLVWKKDGKIIGSFSSPNTQMLLDKSLLIYNAELSDSGVYSCAVQSSIGYSEDSITVSVTGVYPKIIEAPADTAIEIGENGRLSCVALGTPKPKIIWKKKTELLNKDHWEENIFEIKNASLSDAGVYTCVAENILGQTKSEAVVSITGGVVPILDKDKDIEVKKILIGDKVELQCITLGGKPTPTKEWYKDGTLLSQQPTTGIKLENGSYFLSSVSTLDIGLYECIAKNEIGSDIKKINLRFYEAPTIDLSTSSNIVATVGKPAKLLCKVSGDPPPKVTWKRHFISNNRTMRGFHSEDMNALVFDTVTEEDSGRYICQAENIAGIARRTFGLSVMIPPKIIPWPIETFVEVGNIVTLECRVRAIPRPSLHLLKNNVTIPRTKSYGQFVRFLAEPSDSGTYSCIAENRAGSDKVETNLIVLVPPQIRNTTGNTIIKAISGNEAVLPCDVFGNPQPSVTWHFNGELIKKQIGSEPATLRLLNVTEADAGTYVCVAQNKAGENKKKMELLVLTPPRIVLWTEPMKVIIGEFVNVTCLTFANPEASISWFKDKEPLPLNFVRDKKTIGFIVERQSQGIYTCEARNEAGIDSKDFPLVVLYPPSFAKHLPFSVDVLKGNKIEIPCIAFGDPKPIMGWNRNEIILTDDSRRIINTESGQLTILNAAPEDDGYYNCTAENRAGIVWRTVEVNVLELPTASVAVTSQMVKEGDEVEFTCNVTGKPRPKIYWKKDGRILSSDSDSKLRLTVVYRDRGNYTCVVKNSAGESFSTIPIEVSVLPKIHNEKDEKITILKGSSIILNCSADGVPDPDILWFFNETQLGESNTHLFREKGKILVLNEVTTENTGTYTCVAKNFAGWVDKKFSVHVHVKPKIISRVDNQLIIQKGKDSSIPCYAEGIPEPRISWKKGDKEILSKNYSDSSVAVHNNILLLFNSDHNSEGLYTCTATNVEGEDTKDYFINIKDNKQSVKEGIKELEIVEGENGVLKCDVKPGSKVIWLKDNKTLANMPLERADDVHFVIGDGGKVLKITEAFSEDAGLYSCISVHPDGNSTTYYSLKVKFPPYFSDPFPTLDYIVRENESIKLECVASGSPPPQINWRLAENNLPITSHTLPHIQIHGDYDNTLLIKSAKLFHSSLYLCSASNDLGTENRIFNVKVISPPQRLGPEVSEVEIVSGSKLELNCSMDGSPLPNFKWTYKPEYGEERTLRFVTRNIYIGYAQAENEGLYTCFAYNIAGNSTKSFSVSVIDLPRIKRDINNTVVLAEGDDLELACKCQGRKQALVQWFFNGVHLNESNNITQDFFRDFNSTRYVCKLANVSKENEGSYKCLISNLAGTDEQKYEVIVIAAPKMLNDNWRKLRKLEFLSGSTIEIECPVESVDEFKIQWKKNGLIMDGFENKTLYIPSSTIDDKAEYICIASNIAGQLASKVVVNVLASPKLLNSSSNATEKVLLDEKLVLNCSVTGNPTPTILWTRNMKYIDNITFPQVVLSENNQILEIDEVDISDTGKYSCYCSNTIGSVENHFNVEIIVPPMVNEESKSMQKIMKTDLYRRVVLRCPLIASPEPNITWYKESEEISTGIPSMFVSQDKKMLIINHPRESDAGIYKCVGSNNVGDETFTFFLYVSIIMEWGQWSEWTECNSSCGGGVQTRTRECLGDKNEITNEYIQFKNSSCSGPNSENKPCNLHTCPINGNWSDWGDWSECSSTCGEGLKRRTRRCNNPPPSNGGDDCVGETYEDKKCENVPCPINGNWGEWSDWSECSATCGYSIKMRTRRCNSPAPAFSGLPCSGNSRDVNLCKKPKCEENYVGWASWSGWSPCSVTCGTGRQTRKRFCLGGVYSVACKGDSRQNKWCQKGPCHKRRVRRSAELNIYGELNGLPIEETILAEIEETSNETKITAVPLNITENTITNSSLERKYNMTNIPFIISPVSWLAAHEIGGKNGFSLINGSFHENTTYKFSTGEEMEMQSDAEIDDSLDPLKINIEVKGQAPIENKATIIIDPYDEDIVQTNRKSIKSSSHTTLQTNGKTIPVSWRKNIELPANRHNRIFPVERLKSNKQRSKYNRRKGRIEYQTGAVVTSSFENGSCPKGFKYSDEDGECQDINECVRKWQNNCYPSEICINTIGSYICECRQGYRERPDKGGCKDINECLEGSHLCSHTCQNTKGSYQCLCPYNMILSDDFFNCVEVSEEEYEDYSMDLHNIDYFESSSAITPFSKKSNRKGLRNLSFDRKGKYNNNDVVRSDQNKDDITCKPGFKAEKNECEDVNECIEDEYACSKQELCMNTPGSYVCIDAPCPDKFIFSPETRSCLLFCLDNEVDCTDGALISESLQIITVPVYKANYTFYPFTEILVLFSYDDNNLPIDESVYEIVQNESGLPVKIRSEEKLGVLYASNYFEVENKERLILMSSTYDSNGDKLHSTMFLILIYNTKSVTL